MAVGDLVVKILARADLGNPGAHYAHHGGAAVVELDVKFIDLLLALELFAEIARSVVARVVEAIPDNGLEKSDEDDDLRPAEGWHVQRAHGARAHVLELDVGSLREVARKMNASIGRQETHHRCHANAPVLALNGAAAGEIFWLRGHPLERIIDTERARGTKFLLYDHGDSFRRTRHYRGLQLGTIEPRLEGRSGPKGERGDDSDELHGFTCCPVHGSFAARRGLLAKHHMYRKPFENSAETDRSYTKQHIHPTHPSP